MRLQTITVRSDEKNLTNVYAVRGRLLRRPPGAGGERLVVCRDYDFVNGPAHAALISSGTYETRRFDECLEEGWTSSSGISLPMVMTSAAPSSDACALPPTPMPNGAEASNFQGTTPTGSESS